jgi:hypothetical protein
MSDAMDVWDHSEGANAAPTAGETANYIASLSDELAQLARRSGLDALGYILDMARLEAEQITKE